MPHTDLVAFTFWATPELRDSVKRLSRVTGKTVQALMVEAMEDLVRKYGQVGTKGGRSGGAPT